MTQLERATVLLERFDRNMIFRTRNYLERIVDEAQNSPPEGGSDGSINEEKWLALRDAVHALSKFLGVTENFPDL